MATKRANGKMNGNAPAFPEWVETPARQSKGALATKRLRYLIQKAALDHTTTCTQRELAILCDCERSTISTYIRRGWFSKDMSATIEAKLGRDYIRAEWLTNPVAI